MALVIGLGNPGSRYARTRHNVGWRVVEILARRWKADPEEGPASVRAWRADRVADPPSRPVHLLLPQTFMNLSGETVADWRAEHDLEADDLLVVSDDVYLPLGTLRLRREGSSGGHRGLESIEAALGHRGYARLRVGVGAAGSSGELREHVLEEFDAEEAAVIDEVLERAADAVECWVREGPTAAMNRFNRRTPKEDSTT
ncbi:MAG TPA: aminoacyl-tRNA hydrolase [Candidatus Eisenbacteria bacterium]